MTSGQLRFGYNILIRDFANFVFLWKFVLQNEFMCFVCHPMYCVFRKYSLWCFLFGCTPPLNRSQNCIETCLLQRLQKCIKPLKKKQKWVWERTTKSLDNHLPPHPQGFIRRNATGAWCRFCKKIWKEPIQIGLDPLPPPPSYEALPIPP